MVYETKNSEAIYSGGYSGLDPNSSYFGGQRLGFNAGQLSSTTSIQSANQVSEVVSRIKEGVKNVELQPIQPEVFEQIPKQQFQEVKAIMQLSGVKPSIHAPIIDTAGFGEKGWEGDEAREDAERRLFSVIEKAKDIDYSGNIPVVIHSSGASGGSTFRPKEGSAVGDKDRFEQWQNVAINRETGQMAPVKMERKFYPGDLESLEGEGRAFTPEKQINSLNNTEWENKLTELSTFRKHADEVMGNAKAFLAEYGDAEVVKEYDPMTKKPISVKLVNSNGDELKEMSGAQGAYYDKMRGADIFLENVTLNFQSIFDKAYKYSNSDEVRKELKKVAKEYSEGMNRVSSIKEGKNKIIQKESLLAPPKKMEVLDNAIKRVFEITKHSPPEVYTDIQSFAKEKTSDTIGNVAYKSYKNLGGEKAPVLALENMYQGMTFSKAEDLKSLIKESRDKFAGKLVSEERMNKKKAQKVAEKLIGATWDVGHLNMMKKHGFTDKDVIDETKRISKMVKHVHLTDNFGYSDSHLAPGMGNVPFKGILEQLEKTGRLKDMRAVIEAGALTNPQMGLKQSPFLATMRGMGSSMYGAKMAPYWDQTANVQGGYFGFPMAYLPEKHFSMYGSGFSTLPEELGGQVPGSQSRFSGTNMS